MKSTSSFAIVTIFCGTVIVLAPIIQNIVTLAMITHLLALDPKGDYHLNGLLSHSYEGWCLFVGICLFLVGVVLAFRATGDRDAQAASTVTPRISQASNA